MWNTHMHMHMHIHISKNHSLNVSLKYFPKPICYEIRIKWEHFISTHYSIFYNSPFYSHLFLPLLQCEQIYTESADGETFRSKHSKPGKQERLQSKKNITQTFMEHTNMWICECSEVYNCIQQTSQCPHHDYDTDCSQIASHCSSVSSR